MSIKNQNLKRGFTLIEVLVYIFLFSILVTGGIYGAYELIYSSRGTENKILVQAEADFLLRKIDWSLNGLTSFSVPNVHELVVGSSDFTLSNGAIMLNGAYRMTEQDANGDYDGSISVNTAGIFNLNAGDFIEGNAYGEAATATTTATAATRLQVIEIP